MRRERRWVLHTEQAELENIDFLLSVGLHRDHVARRLGMSRDTLDKKLQRREQSHPDSIPATGDSEGGGQVSPVRRSRPSRSVAPPQG